MSAVPSLFAGLRIAVGLSLVGAVLGEWFALPLLKHAGSTKIGDAVFDEGDPADGLYFVAEGRVAVDVRLRSQEGHRRISTIGAGSSFGELALVDGNSRSTRIVALEPTICFVLTAESFAELRRRDPTSASELVMAIARSLSARLRSSTADVAAFEER